jgi:hypothetical protein
MWKTLTRHLLLFLAVCFIGRNGHVRASYVFAHKNKILMTIELEPTVSIVCSRDNEIIPILVSNVVLADDSEEADGVMRLLSFQLVWPSFHNLKRQYHVVNGRTITEKVIKGKRTATWRRLYKDILGVSVIVDLTQRKTRLRAETFINRTFTEHRRPNFVQYWQPSFRSHGCPTFPFNNDSHHSSGKVVGTTLTHYLVWQEFYRSAAWRQCAEVDCDGWQLIFEGDAQCGVEDCEGETRRALAAARSDVVYLGWCDGFKMIKDEDKKLHKTGPPFCLHAYAITVSAARILLDKVYPCLLPADNQLRTLGLAGAISFELADMTGTTPLPVVLSREKRQGTEPTEGIFHQDW